MDEALYKSPDAERGYRLCSILIRYEQRWEDDGIYSSAY